MSYTPTTWESGDTITSQKLNKMEQGIASAGGIEPLVINVIYDETLEYHRLDKTFGEIYSAFIAGQPMFIYNEYIQDGFSYKNYYAARDCSIIENTTNNTFSGSVDSYNTDSSQTEEGVFDLYPHEYID